MVKIKSNLSLSGSSALGARLIRFVSSTIMTADSPEDSSVFTGFSSISVSSAIFSVSASSFSSVNSDV